jgi:hypothetical protein
MGIDPTPIYACGKKPMVGDLIEFGTRHRRMIVTRVSDETASFTIRADEHDYTPSMIGLMKLVARHGDPLEVATEPSGTHG